MSIDVSPTGEVTVDGLLHASLLRELASLPGLIHLRIRTYSGSEAALLDYDPSAEWCTSGTSFSSLAEVVLEGWEAGAPEPSDCEGGLGSSYGLSWLHACRALRSLQLTRCITESVRFSSRCSAPSAASFWTQLESLSVSHDPHLSDLAFLTDCQQLHALALTHLRHSPGLTEALRHLGRPVSSGCVLERLTSLDLSHTDLLSLDWMVAPDDAVEAPSSAHRCLPQLEVLRLAGCTKLTSVLPLFPRVTHDGEKEALALPFTTIVPHLRVLDLSFTAVADLSPIAALGASLEELYINDCKEIGDCHTIGGLSSLRVLHAESAHFSSLQWIAGCAALEEVNLQRCSLLSDLSPLAVLPRLQRLYCNAAATQQSWIDPSAGLGDHLQVLDIESCHSLGDGAALGCLRGLQSLVLTDVSLTSLAFLERFSQLRELSLTACRSIASDDFAPIRFLPRLQCLKLSDVVLKDTRRFLLPHAACLGTIEKLELSLCFSLSSIVGVGLLKRLSSVLIADAALGDIGPELQHCDQLQEIDVSYLDTVEDFGFLESLPRLRSLSVSRAAASLLPLGTSEKLESLHLSHCFLLTELSSLARCGTCLRHLHLSHVSVEVLDGLTLCPYLEELYLGFCEALSEVRVSAGSAGGCSRLVSLTLHACPKLKSLNWLSEVSQGACQLRELKIDKCRGIAREGWEAGLQAAVGDNRCLAVLEITDSILMMESLRPWLVGRPNTPPSSLRHLLLSGLPSLTHLDGIESLPYLTCFFLLNCAALTRVDSIARCSRLRQLEVSRCPRLTSVLTRGEGVGTYLALDTLQLDSLPRLTSIGSALPLCQHLRILRVSACPQLHALIEDSPGAVLLPRLREMCIINAAMTHLDWMPAVPNVVSLECSLCPSLVSVGGLGDLTNLRRVRVTMCGVQSLDELRGRPVLRGLEEVDFSFCEALRDMSALGEAIRLKRVSGYSTAVSDIRWAERCHAAETIDFRGCKNLQSVQLEGKALTALLR